MKKNIIISGGGTGGHIIPAIAIGEAIEKIDNNIEVIYVSGDKKVERKFYKDKNCRRIPIKVVQKGFTGKIRGLFNIINSIRISIRLIKELKPIAVIGTGGYVSGPVLFAAYLLRVPTLIQEQNSLPGKTNRFLAKFVDEISASYEGSLKYFKRKNVKLLGNPIIIKDKGITREEALKKFNLRNDKPICLIFGGSQGSLKINKIVLETIQKGLIKDLDLQVIWICGLGKYFEEIKKGLEGIETGKLDLRVYEYIEDMDVAEKITDFGVTRAGAITLTELAYYGIPSILVPYPFAKEDHQRLNAQEMINTGSCKMVLDAELTPETLANKIKEMLSDRKKLLEMKEKIKQFSRPQSAIEIAKQTIELAKRKKIYLPQRHYEH